MRKLASTIMFLLVYLAPALGQQNLSNYVRQMDFTDSLSAIISTNWLDGLGRPYAQVGEGLSPMGGDIVTVKIYDGRGLTQREWLPMRIPSSQNPPDVADVAAIASSSVYGEASPFTDYGYEPSPSGRIVSLTWPGVDWRTHGKSMCMAYGLNLQNDVIRFGAAYGGTTLTATGYYAPCELDRKETVDEDGLMSSEYTDLFGNKVMTERGGQRTYYVYDNASNLRFVLPPALDGVLHVGSSYNVLTSQPLRDYAYFYVYDKRGLCTEKKLPGCDPVIMVYDDGGRMAFSQDGRQRSSGDWTFILYDYLGRIVVTGIHGSTSAPSMNGVSALACYTGDGPLAGYATDVGLTVRSLLSVKYYDGYGFLLHHAMADSLSYRTLPPFDEAVGLTSGEAYHVRGHLTGSVTFLLDRLDSITESLYYDSEGRCVQTHRRNVKKGWDHYYYRLNAYTGEHLALRHDHSSSGYPSITETMSYAYDNMRRPLTTTHSVNGSPPVTLSSYTYDAVGRMATKTVGGLDTTAYTYNVRSWLTKISGQRFTERLCYNTSVEGLNPSRPHQYCWSGRVGAYAWQVSGEPRQRGYGMVYDDLGRLTSANYGEGPALDAYYTIYDEMAGYDTMGNPTWIYRKSPNTLENNRPSSPSDRLHLEYDGNQLVHVTDSVSIGHTYAGAFHFADGADETMEYEYDENGNMTKDLNRNILSIEYNLLNLPSMIEFEDHSFISNTYSATGEKLSTSYGISLGPVLSPLSVGNAIGDAPLGGLVIPGDGGIPGDDSGNPEPQAGQFRYYCGDVVYDMGTTRLLTDEGYVTFSSDGTPQYHYYLRDHLGNVRVVFDQTGTVEQVNHYYAFGGLMRESSNPGMQPYKYGGKELDRTGGLDAYDFGARSYFADRLQWSTMDPLCEKYYEVTPYGYCHNDPVNSFDPDGRDWYRTGNGTLIWNPEVHSQDDIGKKDADRGYKYVGETYYDKETRTSYRKDGTVLYSNEELAYQRMWYLADVHWRSNKYPAGKEEMAYLLSDGKVLIMADNWNVSDKSYSKGYHRKKGILYSSEGESFAYVGQVHTHQMGGDKGLSHSDYRNDDDNFAAADPDRPVFIMHKNGNIYAGVFSSKKNGFDNFGNQPIGTINNLFKGYISLVDCSKIIRSKF